MFYSSLLERYCRPNLGQSYELLNVACGLGQTRAWLGWLLS